MSTIITIANQKGGVAKTTTTSALSAGLKIRGYSVLAIDLDPQGNLSSSVGVDTDNCLTVYDLLLKKHEPQNIIQKLQAFDIIPADILLAGAEHELVQTGKEFRLEETLQPIIKNYDYIIIDTPPSLGILTTNAIMIADEIIIPSTAGVFSTKGIQQLRLYINSIIPYRKRITKLKISGILITKYNPRTIISQKLKTHAITLANMMETKVFDTYIRFSITVEEAQASKSDLYTYANSTVTEDYNSFIDEYLKGDN